MPPSKPFLSFGEVYNALGVTRSMLQDMCPYLPHIRVHGTHTRLFPTSYIQTFAAVLQRYRVPATVPRARDFWKTPEAQRLIHEARSRIGNSFRSTGAYRLQGLIELLGVPKSTLSSWVRTSVLRAERRGRTIFIPTNEVRKVLDWVFPTH